MKVHELKFKNYSQNYSIIIGDNSLSLIQKKLKDYVPKLKKFINF